MLKSQYAFSIIWANEVVNMACFAGIESKKKTTLIKDKTQFMKMKTKAEGRIMRLVCLNPGLKSEVCYF